MTDQNPTQATSSTPAAKPSIKDRLLRRTDPANKPVKTASPIKDKVKTGLAVVGVVSIAAVVASKVAKDKGVESVSVDLPSVDVTTDPS